MLRLLVTSTLVLFALCAACLAIVVSPAETEVARIQLSERPLDYSTVQISPDSRLLTYPEQGGREMTLWSIDDRQSLATVTTNRIADTVVFSPDSALLATVDIEGNARLWDIATGTPRLGLNGDVPAVEDVAFSPDGSSIITLGKQGETRLWDLAAGTIVARFEGNDAQSFNVLVSPHGRVLASSSNERMLHVWNLVTGEHRSWIRFDSVGRILLFTPDDRYVLTYGGGGFTRLWDTNTGEMVGRVNYYGIYTSAITPAGHVLMGGKRGGENQLHLFDVTTGQQLYTVGAAWAAFSPDSRWLATASGPGYRDGVTWRGLGAYEDAVEIWLWNVATRSRWVIYRGHSHIERLWFSPDGRRIVFVDGAAVLHVLQIA